MSTSSRTILQARRAASALIVLIAMAVAASPLIYLVRFNRFPPTRLNLFLWISPTGEECIRQALKPERAPFFGTGVGLGDICPESKFGPGTYDSILDGPWLWISLLVIALLAVAWSAWPTSRTRAASPRGRGP